MSVVRASALLLPLALAASLLTGCASTRGTKVHVLPPRPASGGPPAVEPPPARPTSESAIVRSALEYLGTPYVLGGTSPAGFDCSGFVKYVYRLHGIDLPRNVVNQAGVGRHVDREDIRPGDLVFFSTTGPGFTHVGIATSRDGFVHAPNSRGVIRVEPLNSPYWSQRFAGARRVVSSPDPPP